MSTPTALTPPSGAPTRVPARTHRRPSPLALVSLAYGLVQLAAVVPWLGLGWDESVYVSQTDPHHPAAYFSAPRSRGVTYLTAPLTWLTNEPHAVHLWLALLSTACLYGAFAVWRPLLGAGRSALAAGLFASLWTALLYGPQAMPNLWVALGAVAATGWLLRGAAGTAGGAGARGRAWWGVALAVAGVTLLRIPDGCWLALPLGLACLAHRPLRRLAPMAAVAGGVVAGAVPWVVEAYGRWGGIGERLRVSSDVQGEMGLRWAGGDAWLSVNGPLLCRPCDIEPYQPWLTWWWLLLPVLGLVCAVRGRHGAGRAARGVTVWLPLAGALALSLPYLLTLGYSAPRFFLPAYALLALPLATTALDAARGRRPYVVALCAVLALYGVSQTTGLWRNLMGARHTTHRYETVAAHLHRAGVRPPCLITGAQTPPVSYAAGCASGNVAGNNKNLTRAALRALTTRIPVAALTAAHAAPPAYARTWHPLPLPGTGLRAWVAGRG
ncbi:hypothetical protein [Streptomyces sp. CLI2509]|uniref:hypothetical protein n=1 Tax=Streptomyces sp. CLI2509 TaxID=1984801 RepID=UPI000BAC5EFE|nr:hypothetical protein [Streptomyces sp. CLI2509]ASY34853.1 hypothetical protein CAC01_20995 [Streptomyces sp. CLI2509]